MGYDLAKILPLAEFSLTEICQKSVGFSEVFRQALLLRESGMLALQGVGCTRGWSAEMPEPWKRVLRLRTAGSQGVMASG
jgi:hypothetical protein